MQQDNNGSCTATNKASDKLQGYKSKGPNSLAADTFFQMLQVLQLWPHPHSPAPVLQQTILLEVVADALLAWQLTPGPTADTSSVTSTVLLIAATTP
jgi:hypothetical protein